MPPFRFKKFSLSHDRSALKIGTDALLLASLTDVKRAEIILDIGCGCGVVAFCLAQQSVLKGDTPQIYGVDSDHESIIEADENADNYPLLPRTAFHFIGERIQDFANGPAALGFDLIVSNPPFFQGDLKPQRESSLRSKHADGQLPFEELLQSVLKMLKQDGRFALILPPAESERFDQLAQGRLFCHKRVRVRPVAGKPVHRVVSEYARQEGPCKESGLTIRETPNAYTNEYAALMEPYLL